MDREGLAHLVQIQNVFHVERCRFLKAEAGFWDFALMLLLNKHLPQNAPASNHFYKAGGFLGKRRQKDV